MKKLLILGGNYTEIEIVKRSQKLGYYTIVTDNHEDWTLSPAKQIADEGWNISWSDVDILEKKCREEKIDGVLAGFSEFRVENMIKLCNRLNLPCSLTMDQLEITRNKILFKETCRKYNLKTIQEYRYEDVKKFPVIIKPVDRAGSIGINVAFNKEDLEKYFQIALSLSPSKNVIIEDYITNGVKFDVYYYVQGDSVIFLGSSDTIMCKGEIGAKILQKCWPFRSKYEKKFRSSVEKDVKKMFAGLGIKNAYATMSAFYLDGEFYFFEAGFRLSGEMSFNYYEAFSGIDYVNSMIKFSLNEDDAVTYKDCVNQNNYSAVLNFFCTDGRIADIYGIETIKQMKTCCTINQYVKLGDIITNKTNVFSKALMVTLIAESEQKLISAIKLVNITFDIKDQSGNSMVYERVSDSELEKYYGK